MQLRLKSGTTVLLIGVVSVATITGCGAPAQKKTLSLPPLAVSVQTVQMTNQSIGDTFLGQITPFIQTVLSPGESGQLATLTVRVGQTVKAGQLLATLNHTTVVPSENAALQASAALSSAQRQYQDQLALYNDNTSAAQQVANAQNAVSEQAAALQTAKVNLAKAQLQEEQQLNGNGTPQDLTALQAAVAADQQALTTEKQQLTLAQSNLTLAEQTLKTNQLAYGSITQADVTKAAQTYYNALSSYNAWQQGAYAGTNPYATEESADYTIYNTLNQDYNSLQNAQQSYNSAQAAVNSAQSQIATDESNLAKDQKALADATPGSDTNLAQQAMVGLKASEAALAQAQAQYNSAVTSLKLTKQIVADHTQAKQALDNALNQVNQDKVNVNTSQQSLQVAIQNGQVISPISGVVQSVGAQVGQQVGTQTSLVTIAATSPQMATVDVPETDIGKIHQGSPMNIYVPTLSQTYQGRVLDIHPQLSTSTNEYPVDVVISGMHSQLLPGLQVQAQLANSSTQKEILVPADAVLSLQSGANEVFVEKGGKVQSQIVEVGAMSPTQYQITGGLTVGEKLVVQGQNLLSSGDTVKVVSVDGSKVNFGEATNTAKSHGKKSNLKKSNS